MKKRYFIAVTAIAYALFHNFVLADKLLIAEGNNIIEKIESYKVKYGKLPDNLEAVGAAQDIYYGAFWYTNNETYFTIHYGASLGESVTYDSRKGEWLMPY